MRVRKLSDKEKEKMMTEAKKGDKLKMEIIVENFQGLVTKNYNNIIYNQVSIGFEDYKQQCYLKIIECINKTENKNYWQLSSLIEKSIRNLTIDCREKHNKFESSNVFLGTGTDVYKYKGSVETCKFDENVISNMTVKYLYNNFIKDKLSRKENNVFCLYISGKRLDKYAKEKGIKHDSVKRTLRRAVDKIRNIEQLKSFYYITATIFVFLNNMEDLVEFFNLI